MPEDILFNRLLKSKTLLAGWHLTRNDALKDFIVDDFGLEAFASNLGSHIADIKMQLSEGRYRFSEIESVFIPKGEYGTRPGSILTFRDRVVLWSIVSLIAPELDEHLHDGVLSFRIKSSASSGDLFEEKEELAIPFLKTSYITKEVSPFSSWMYNWREFDKKSKEALAGGLKYMATTDISAYFENINLDVMRDHLMSRLPDEHRLLNLLFDALQSWTVPTVTGHRPRRGIPQGTGVSSFLGNLFLIPVDRSITDHSFIGSVVYLRYMDDIRVFCANKLDATRSLLRLERGVRKLHLSIQSAKTKIIEGSDIEEMLHDQRIVDIVSVRKFHPTPRWAPGLAISKLRNIGKITPSRGRKLEASVAFRDGLYERSTRMWMNSLMYYGSPVYLKLLVRIVLKNPDPRYSDILIRSCRRFPKFDHNRAAFLHHIRGDDNIFSYHEGALIDAFRYQHKPSPDLRHHCLSLLQNSEMPSKLSAIRYLAKFELSVSELNTLSDLWAKETSEVCRLNMVMLLAQHGVTEFARLRSEISRLPSVYAVDVSQLIRSITAYNRFSRSFLSFMLDKRQPFRLADWIGVAWVVTHTDDKRLRAFALKAFVAREGVEADPLLRIALNRMIVRLT